MVNYRSIYENKVVWITGASSGIGEQAAYQLNALGVRLILSARNEEQLLITAKRCKTNSPVRILPVDLNEQQSLRQKCCEALEFFGHIDFLFNIAGIAHRDLALNTEISIDRKIMQINYFGTIELSKFIIPAMIENGGGHILVTSSLSGKYGIPMLSAYAASKHALQGFFSSLRSEVMYNNIKITIVIPGLIKTNIIENALTGDGSVYGKNLKIQDKGYPSEMCARKIIEAVAKEKEEVFVGGKEGLSLFLNRLFPGSFSGIIRNHPVKKLRKLRGLFMPEKNNKTDLNF